MRQRMVTRTIPVKRMKVLALNKNTNEVYETSVSVVSRKSPEHIIDKLNKENAASNVKYLHALSVTEEKVRYGMPEQNFMRQAEVLGVNEDMEDSEE